jgi:hypothetical protein
LQDLILLSANVFDPDNVWTIPLATHKAPIYYTNDLFDQNGYDLSPIEQTYAKKHNTRAESHRETVVALRNPWFIQSYKEEGAVLNHALLFQRKGFGGAALEQLKMWAKEQPAYYKLINIRSKWGLDFSMDYYDREGNTFEVLHWEYDCFDYNEAVDKKQEVQGILSNIDWDDAAKEILKRKDEWFNLDFFKQSDYKCNYFGIGSERWKMVVWK